MKNINRPISGYISVIMPVYNQASFIKRAIVSLLNQTYKDWELIIINDGSTDGLYATIEKFFTDKRISYIENENNKGLGYSLNLGISRAKYDFISYLPADDIYYKDHLQTLYDSICLGFDMAHAGMIYKLSLIFDGENYGKKIYHKVDGFSFQLVQVLHKKTSDRWVEREELVTDDLGLMFFDSFIRNNDRLIGTREITCEWTHHPRQRHKFIKDTRGGNIYLFKNYYNIKKPIRFRSSDGVEVNECERYKFYPPKNRHHTGCLKILLVGELSYNPERIYALEERGHKLYGLWIKRPYAFNSTGPFSFGNIEDISIKNWKDEIQRIEPDVIYSLLNYPAIPLAYEVLSNNTGIPFIWHYKESPIYARHVGLWDELIHLYTKSDGQIYNNELTYEWFNQFMHSEKKNNFILDGDLQKNTYFKDDRSPLLSEKDGETHLLVAGRPYGITPHHISQLANQKIHLHIYGNTFHNRSKEMLDNAKKSASGFLHLHDTCPPESFVKEFSKYDAGLLHYYKSDNHNELMRVNWNDLNLPARMSTYAMAGLPMLIYDNSNHRVASQELLEKFDMAIKYASFHNLKDVFEDKNRIKTIRENVWSNRQIFSFDYYVDDLISFFRQVIIEKK